MDWYRTEWTTNHTSSMGNWVCVAKKRVPQFWDGTFEIVVVDDAKEDEEETEPQS